MRRSLVRLAPFAVLLVLVLSTVMSGTPLSAPRANAASAAAPTLSRSRLYVDGRNYLVLEFCGTNIHQDVYVGSKRSGRDFGVHTKRADFGGSEQCATDDNLADGAVLAGTTYYSGVALQQQNVYSVCSSSNGLCDSFTTGAATAPSFTRSRLYVDSRSYLVLEFCGKNIHQDVYIGSKRAGRDFGVQTKRVDFGASEQCATADNLADGTVLPGTTYYSGVALQQPNVYNVCSSSGGLCDSATSGIPASPTLTRSRLYVDSRSYLVLEFCGININQNVYIGSKRDGRDFGTHAKQVNIGGTEQCVTDDNLADGAVLPGTSYSSGVALQQQDVYSVCSSSGGLCDSVVTEEVVNVVPPTLTHSRLYTDARNYLVLEFCGINIHQDVSIGSRRDGRDFGVHTKSVDFGASEQCATDDNLADGTVLPGTTYSSGVALQAQDVYGVCGSSGGLCDSLKTPVAFIVPQPSPGPSGTYNVPFFPQGYSPWSNKHFGRCSPTISEVGCALTSATMLLNYYKVNYNPGTLADALGQGACPLDWNAVAKVSNGRVTGGTRRSFTWNGLETELRKGPVILELTRAGGYNHFVVVVSGSGSNPADYLVNDPALENGQNTRLSAVLPRRGGYTPTGMRIYSGTSTTQITAEANTLSSLPLMPSLHQAPNTEVITGSVTLYRNTELTMTLHLSLANAEPENAEMLISTDILTSTTWQPFSPYVDIPLTENVTVQFRDSAGTLSDVVASTPVIDLPIESYSVFLPLATR